MSRWEPLSSLQPCSRTQHTHTHTHTHTHSLSLTHTHTHTHSPEFIRIQHTFMHLNIHSYGHICTHKVLFNSHNLTLSCTTGRNAGVVQTPHIRHTPDGRECNLPFGWRESRTCRHHGMFAARVSIVYCVMLACESQSFFCLARFTYHSQLSPYQRSDNTLAI